MNVHAKQIRPAGLTIAEFLAFTAGRPNGERWELIEGQPVLNPSPITIHQLIVGNINRLLLEEKDRQSAAWLPLPGIGTVVPASQNSLPVPDILVMQREPADQYTHATDDVIVLFEVLSRSNTKANREWRRKAYASIPNCQHYITVATRKIEVRRYDRANDWAETVIDASAKQVTLSALGTSLSLADIYRHTKLAPAKGR
ncbi:MAG: Uma2 family endonuclease [Hyphomicrobiaceae bacterium]